MKKLVSVVSMLVVILVFFVATFAIGNGTLTETIQKQQEEVSEGDEDVDSGISENYGRLLEASSVDLNNEQAREATSNLSNILGVAVNVLAYVLVGGSILRALLDLTYILLPFTRSTLHKQSAQAAMVGYGGMGNMGGFNGGYGNSGYGNSGYGGYGNSGYGGYGNMGNGAMQQSGNGIIGRIQFVSEAAIKAVALASQQMPDGSSPSALKTYSKDLVIAFILTTILIVLATNGVLFTLGIKLGEAISRALNGGMIKF